MMNNSPETFGCKIKALRKHSCITQSNIANFLKVDQSFIEMVEKGERVLTSDMIEKLEALFLVELNSFQETDLHTNPLSFEIGAININEEDLEVIASVNRIALNSHHMTKLLKGV
jgi:transcriptional regulator with XRE-family HTH domain